MQYSYSKIVLAIKTISVDRFLKFRIYLNQDTDMNIFSSNHIRKLFSVNCVSDLRVYTLVEGKTKYSLSKIASNLCKQIVTETYN